MGTRANQWAWLIGDRAGRPDPMQISVRLWRARESVPGLSPQDVSFVDEMVRSGYPGPAFDRLCARIDEDELTVDDDLVRELEWLGAALGADRSLTDRLRARIPDA